MGAVRRELSVSPRLKELAICTVARITGAEYEFTHHWPEYVKAGGRDDLRPRLEDPDRAMQDAQFSEDERLAMRYAGAVTRTVKVPDALFEEVRRRFTPTEIVELTAAIATYNMVARLLLPLDIEPDAK